MRSSLLPFLLLLTATLASAQTGINHYGFHINNDGLAMDLDGNGGMMGGGDPTSFSNFFGLSFLTDGPGGRGLDFDNDADFQATGSIGQNDNYSNLWLALLHVSASNAGSWEFRNAGDDDRAGIWLDIDQNGVFASTTSGLGSNRGEQLSWEDTGTKSVTLAAGDYLIAFTHREGGGGSRAEFRFRAPTFTGEVVVKPSDPAQAGIWLLWALPPTSVVLVGTTLTISNPGPIDEDKMLAFDGTTFTLSDPLNLITTSLPGSTGDMTNTVTFPLGTITDILVEGGLGDDSLGLDFSAGNFTVPIHFDGGAETLGDSLQLSGGSASTAVFEASAPGTGSISVPPNPAITYTGLE